MSSKYMIQLDGLRFIAVSAVMLGHWINISHLRFLNSFGAAGVNMFFVLSGFLITGILIWNKQNPNISTSQALKQFYIRRFLRIFPLYYFVLFIGVVLVIPSARQYFFWHLSYLSNYIIGWTQGQGGSYSHLWSLAVEEQFYIFFPFLVFYIPLKYLKKIFSIFLTFFCLTKKKVILRGVLPAT